MDFAYVCHPGDFGVLLNFLFVFEDLVLGRYTNDLTNLFGEGVSLLNFIELLDHVNHLFLIADNVQPIELRIIDEPID